MQLGGSSRRGRWRIGWRERHPLLPCTPPGSHLGLVISISGRSSLRFVSPGSVVLRGRAGKSLRASGGGGQRRRQGRARVVGVPSRPAEEGTDRPGGVGMGVVSSSSSHQAGAHTQGAPILSTAHNNDRSLITQSVTPIFTQSHSVSHTRTSSPRTKCMNHQ